MQANLLIAGWRIIVNELTDEVASRNRGLLPGTEPDCARFEVASSPI